MSIPDKYVDLYAVLQRKRDFLFELIVRLQNKRTLANESLMLHKIDVARSEKERVLAVMSDIRNNTLLAPPPEGALDDIQAAIARLQSVIGTTEAVTELVAAGDALIAAWPNA
jgi:hypothetical protein